MDSYRIPFNKPCLAGRELQYVADAISRGNIAGGGHFTAKCRELLRTALRVPHVLLTTSCTHALEMAALLLDIAPGDEVIVPSFTFVSCVNAFVLRGAKPVFADVRRDTLNLDDTCLESLITPRTKAIVVVHYAGVACSMDTIGEIAARHGIAIVEDNAHGLFASFQGRPLGTFGTFATLSFHETKNIICGEGGALLINDAHLMERAEIIHEKGTNRNRYFRGQIDKYTWVDVGSSYAPSEILAAFLYAQLEAREVIHAARRRLWDRYANLLCEWARLHDVRLPYVPGECEQSYHMFYILLPSLAVRHALIAHLKSRGILAVFHYQALHLSDMGQRFGGRPGMCPVTEEASDCLLRLPFFNDLSVQEQGEVVDGLLCFDGWNR
jgi:dTDP-4-amino-4,6-dideoxygalactose transaminase